MGVEPPPKLRLLGRPAWAHRRRFHGNRRSSSSSPSRRRRFAPLLRIPESTRVECLASRKSRFRCSRQQARQLRQDGVSLIGIRRKEIRGTRTRTRKRKRKRKRKEKEKKRKRKRKRKRKTKRRRRRRRRLNIKNCSLKKHTFHFNFFFPEKKNMFASFRLKTHQSVDYHQLF